MDIGLAKLLGILDALEADPAWIWPPIDRTKPSEEKIVKNRYPHDPVDLAFADTVYKQLLVASIDEGEARERLYKHLVVVHQWDDDRAKYASGLAMELECMV